MRHTPDHSPNSPTPPISEYFYHISSAISLTIFLLCYVERNKCTSLSQGVISHLRLFCGHPYPQSTSQQDILSRQGHRKSKSFTLIAIVKERGPLSTTMRAKPSNHISCIAMKRGTRVDNILTQSRGNIVFKKTGTVETINYLSAGLSSGESISADDVDKLVKAVGGKFKGIMFAT